ncbi:MAG TPA: PEP-CTERM sorting domain-containing protein [Candidatus Acidoferrum sp.]|nr:PEP-CTERM sorting domain-containing protein [Candidatus Acidoferrum sp.]
MKILLTLVLVGSLAFVREANAQFLTGSLTASSDFNGASFTSSSLSLVNSNTIDSDSGSFGILVPPNSLLMASVNTISGLSTSPLADSINNLFVFSYPLGGSASTTPPNRFDFNLAAIAENSDNGTTAEFTGTGTIIDTTGAFQDTPGQFIVNFSNSSFYTITLETVPEPATASLAVAGLLGALVLRRRKG